MSCTCMQFLCTQVFFIDHEHELTTFVDPRLPLPNQQFTYTPVQATVPARRTSYDNTGLRPHHTTTVRHSQSLDSDLAMSPATPTTPTTTQGASLAPPSSSTPPSRESSRGNDLSVRGAGGSGGNDGTSSARSSIISESAAPPSECVYLPPLVLMAGDLHVYMYTVHCNWLYIVHVVYFQHHRGVLGTYVHVPYNIETGSALCMLIFSTS